MISKYRPKSPIVAVTSDEQVGRRLALVWGVQAFMAEKRAASTDEMLDTAIQTGMDAGLIGLGDTVVITAGVPVAETGTTNLMKIHVVGEEIAKGQGIGRKAAKGKVVVAKTAAEAVANVNEGDILVTTSTDKDMIPAIEKLRL